MIKPLSSEDIPRYLPHTFRKCADEDGVIQTYKVLTDGTSYRVGYEKAQRYTIEQVIEWGNDGCPHSCFDPKGSGVLKWHCPQCWGELRKLVGE